MVAIAFSCFDLTTGTGDAQVTDDRSSSFFFKDEFSLAIACWYALSSSIMDLTRKSNESEITMGLLIGDGIRDKFSLSELFGVRLFSWAVVLEVVAVAGLFRFGALGSKSSLDPLCDRRSRTGLN